MNRQNGQDGVGPADAIDLAREAPFALAHLLVTPAALSVDAGGWSRRLERRAMQVLVVLARAAPAVVGRGELNARVWGGRVVGDDAVNRTVQTLRRLATAAPPPLPFAIETVPRVGYRLRVPAAAVAPGVPAGMAGAPAPARAGRGRWRGPVVAGAAGLGALAAALAWRGAGPPPSPPAPAPWRIAGAATPDDLPVGAGDAAPSPDGRALAYRARDADGRERIFVRQPGGGADRPVSPPGLDAHHPAWSPDGTALAFPVVEAGRPCRLFVVRGGTSAPAGTCETVRDPHVSWSADGRALLFGDAPGENAVQRIVAVAYPGGGRGVLSSPPGDGLGDDLPAPLGEGIMFRRQFGWGDEGWIARNPVTGRERLLWRRGVSGSVAAPLPGGTLAVAWTRAGASGLDLVDPGGRARPVPMAPGPATAIAAAGARLLVEVDRSEGTLVRAEGAGTPAAALATMRGRVYPPVPLPDGSLRFPVASAGVARLWERDPAGAVRPWGRFVAARIVGLAASPDGRFTAALATGRAGREIVLLDAGGRPAFRWNPHARSLNQAAWSADGRHLVVPVLDAAGWRLFALDPFGLAGPRDLGLPGFAVVMARGPALYAVRAGETTGTRELWRLDGRARRLPIDLTLFDIVNWCPAAGGIWLPDRGERDRPRLVLRDADTGRIRRSVPAPGLAGPATGLAADARGPFYVRTAGDAPEYVLLSLAR